MDTIVLIMSTKSSALSDVLFGKIRGGVLALLYGWADKAFYVRQIARHLHASPGAVRRELEKLAAVDLIVRTPLGNQVFYQVNRHHPVFSEMRALVNKTVGIFNTLRSALEPLGNQVSIAFVYGSIARQEERAGSDIDLMIIGDIELDDVLVRLPEAETAVGRPVNPTVYSTYEFKRKLEEGNHFLNAVMEEKKVFLIGNEDELREMAGVRMVKAGAQQRKRNQSIARHRAAKSR
jgi:predicted nucleotidyltransferase